MISESLARCLAKICGDGCMNARYIRYNNTCDILLNEFKEDIQKEFGYVHFTHGKVNSGTSFVQLHGKRIISVFASHLDSFRSNDIQIPLSVKNSSLNIKLAFIRAFYDDEGCAALRFNESSQEWKRNITLSSNSFKILSEIKEFLLSLGIISNEIYRNHASSSYDISHVLSITGKQNFLLFKEKIGFNHPKKAELLNLLLESYSGTPKRKPAICEKIKKKKMNLTFPFE